MAIHRISKYKYFIFLIWVLMLQALRNANMVMYMVTLLVAYMFLFSKFPIKRLTIDKKIVPWFLMYLFMPVISIVNGITVTELTTALIRYLALVPLVIWGVLNLNIFHDYTKDILRVFVLVTVLSAILMVYQLAFGKIQFFAEVTERVGYSRYSSLLGSPTSYGTLAPLALLVLNTWEIFDKKVKLPFQLLIILGGVLSLSKAFFVNIAICVGVSIINNPSFRKGLNLKLLLKITGGIIGVILLGLAFWSIASKTLIGDYFDKMINYSFNDKYNGVNTDLINRMTALPRAAFEYHNLSFLQYIFGIGFKGYSGVLGLSEYPMCHNDYFSLVLAQGLLFFFIIMLLYLQIIVKCIKIKNVHTIFSLNLVIYILINMVAGQWNYLTTFSMIFFLVALSDLHYEETRRYEGTDI